MKGVIVVDIDRCLGCRSCELRCALEHSQSKILHEAVREHPTPRKRVTVEAVDGMAVPLQCRHCEDAPCVKVCPSRALEKPGVDDPVMVHNERCIGCAWCVVACPFGVIEMDGTGRAVIKCDLCIGRLREGRVPACVEGCPTGALQFKGLEEVSAEKRKTYLTCITRGGTPPPLPAKTP